MFYGIFFEIFDQYVLDNRVFIPKIKFWLNQCGDVDIYSSLNLFFCIFFVGFCFVRYPDLLICGACWPWLLWI